MLVGIYNRRDVTKYKGRKTNALNEKEQKQVNLKRCPNQVRKTKWKKGDVSFTRR